ncbi:MAG: hypothetical protein ACI80V_000498 [Rhodothermales bacterium]|jgi:hypothetical protein
MKKILGLVVLAGVAGLLFVSNPSKDEFEDYVQSRVEDRLKGENPNQRRLGRMLTEMGSSIVGSLAARTAERKDFLLFSLYAVDIGADGDPDESWRFVGIGGTFIEISSPEGD